MRITQVLSSVIVALALTWSGVPASLAQDVEPVVVDLDVKPGSDQNPINVKSKGQTELAILGAELFDVTTVDTATLILGEAPVSDCLPVDLNADGFQDLLCLVQTNDIGVLCGEVEVALTGALLDGTPLEGADSVKTVGCKRPKTKPPKPPKPLEPPAPEDQ